MGHAEGDAVRTEIVELDAPDVQALLVDWLSEVLFLFETRDILPTVAAVEVSLEPVRLRGELRGPPASALVQTGPGVKAVTFHGLELHVGDSGSEARVYLDV